ncbi:hypothetical protein ACFW6N_32880 [Streptomyces cyaneofuscatus]|uniref:hypothetical protein n=1 Tax=Streptomyces cyaneofuscatus TaxID=66883 RepID=UPI0036B381A9
MSKYRPKSLPKGSTAGQPEGGAVPAVRTREEIRAEWEASRKAAQTEAASDGDGKGSEASPEAAAASPTGESLEPVEASEPETPVPSDGPSADPSEGSTELLLPGDDGDGLVNLPANRDQNGYVDIPAFTRPESEDPKERLNHYARGIAQAEMAARANEQRVKQQKIIVQGQNFLAIKEEKLWETVGLPDFDALMKARFGFGKNYANKIIRAVPVVMALESVTSMELVEKHLRPLRPVFDAFGPDAVRQVWSEASRKKITEKNLAEAAAFLGFAEPVEQKPKVVPQKAAPAEMTGADGDRVIQAKQAIVSLRATDEVKAREAAIQFMKAAQELCAEFGIDMAETAAG